MKEIYHQYLNNVAEGHRLIKVSRFPASEEDSVLLEQITGNAKRVYQLRSENDELLEKIIFSKRACDLTPDEVDELLEFADQLLSLSQQNDVGIAYKIHCLIFEYAKLHNDLDLYIKELYHLGISLFYLSPNIGAFGINLNGKTSWEYLKEGAGYLAKIEEIESETTRTYILRCVANLYLTDEEINGPHRPGVPFRREDGHDRFKALFEKIMGVLESPYYRKLVPSFQWDNVIYNLHFNRCLHYFNYARNDLPHIVEDMLESAEYLYTHKQKEQAHSTINARVDYLYAATKRRAGLTDFPEVVEVLLNTVETADMQDYSANGVTRNLQLPLYLEYTNKMLTAEQRAPYAERIDKVLARIPEYLKNIPFNAYSYVVNEIVAENIRYCTQSGEPVSERLLDYLLCCHTPTYIHVRLCAALSRKLFLQIVETAPQKAVGIFGVNSCEELIAQKEQLADRVYSCSLYHDIGKIMLLNYIEIYTRRLLPEEFTAICLHPHISAQILETFEGKAAYHAALHHHRFSDCSGGYPEGLKVCPPEYKLLSDIVSVADSMEAATDNVGRCYSASKTLEMIVEELRSHCGVRYARDVVSLFDDEAFFERIKKELQEERQQTYLELYRLKEN